MKKISYLRLFLQFLKTGTISFGGYMMLIAMVQYEFSKRRKFIKKSQVLDAITLASFLPGPMAINVSTYLGFIMKGWRGAILAFIAVLTPSFIIMIIFTELYFSSKNLPGFQSFFSGVLPVVSAVIISVAYDISSKVNKTYFSYLIVALSFFLAVILKGYLAIIVPLLLSGLLNVLYFKKKIFSSIIKRPKKQYIIRFEGIIVAGILLTLFYIFINNVEYDSINFDLIRVFSNISLTLFGGGYVFIPVLDKIIVNEIGWLNSQQFIDCIAMGQITPGPILISATFVGYKMNGIIGALIATFSIFAPSSVIIIFISRFFLYFKNNMFAKKIIQGIKIGIVGLIFYSAIIVLLNKETIDIFTIIVFISSILILIKTKVHPVILIILSGLTGYFLKI
tara:strand:+ start:1352 stop:2533 length:1182 start_codon:yes stop_codon:yes gene_type:complete